jgi:hypothetical protein
MLTPTSELGTPYVKRLRGEASRYVTIRKTAFHKAQVKEAEMKLQRVVETFLNRNHSTTYSPSLVALTGPFLLVFEEESDVCLALEKMAEMLGLGN